jgi:pyrroloquinoline-quinone synthase
MTNAEFFAELDRRIAAYDLLRHPFYQAWAEAKLTREDLRQYAENYFDQVSSFPSYLEEFAARPLDEELRRVVLMNRDDELGTGEASPSHAELWLDFIEGMGGERGARIEPLAEIGRLTGWFHRVAREGAPEEALAAFYAYESQVPRVAAEKERGLREHYGADERTCRYFSLHRRADLYHSRVWEQQLGPLIRDAAAAERGLSAGEKAAQALWQALDGIEAARQARAAALSG